MRLIGNIIWLILVGFHSALVWAFFGCLAFITIIGIPYGKACFALAELSLTPFGKVVVRADDLQQGGLLSGTLGVVLNVVWAVFFGIFILLYHLFIAFFMALTIVGIPFAIQALKIGILGLAPIGKVVLSADAAQSLPSHTRRVAAGIF